jgi:hypothetical protein
MTLRLTPTQGKQTATIIRDFAQAGFATEVEQRVGTSIVQVFAGRKVFEIGSRGAVKELA